MKGKLCTEKGTLIELFIEFDSNQALIIYPLKYNAAIIAFGKESNEFLNTQEMVKENEIVVFDHSGKIVSKYQLDAKIIAIENTVLYSDGSVWSGSVFDELEKINIAYIALTEESLRLVKNNVKLSFNTNKIEDRPTIFVGYKNGIKPLCHWHRCSKCQYSEKQIMDGLI